MRLDSGQIDARRARLALVIVGAIVWFAAAACPAGAARSRVASTSQPVGQASTSPGGIVYAGGSGAASFSFTESLGGVVVGGGSIGPPSTEPTGPTAPAAVLLSGTVTNRYGVGLGGIPVAVKGTPAEATVMTDSHGHYEAMVKPSTYTVAPQPETSGRFLARQSTECTASGGACTVRAEGGEVRADFEMPKLPVVIVTGLSDSHPGHAPGENCEDVGSTVELCTTLENEGHPTYVPSSSATPGASVIYNGGTVPEGAMELTSYVQANIGGPVLFVGHSLGGLFSRAAIDDWQAPAAGLVTIGTPFDGSFGADIDVGALNVALSCVSRVPVPAVVAGCAVLGAVAAGIRAWLGWQAIGDLTAAARSAENATLGPLGVPLWTVAGTACSPGADYLSQYFSPDDGIVGQSSALGENANLGPRTPVITPAFHSQLLKSWISSLSRFTSNTCGLDDPPELLDQDVRNTVQAAANALETAPTSSLHADTLVAEPAWSIHGRQVTARAASSHPASFTVYLLAPPAAKRSGAEMSLPAGSFVASSTHFSLSCEGHTLQALPDITGKAFGIPAGAVRCRDATVSAPSNTQIAVASDAADAKATFSAGTRNKFKVTISARHRITGLVLLDGSKTLHVTLHRHAQSVSFQVSAPQAKALTLIATIAGQRYSATV